METKINVQIKNTPEDYKSLVFFNLFRKKRFMIYFLIIAAALSFGASVGKLTGILEVPDWYFYVCLGFLALLGLQFLLFQFSVKQFLKSDRLVVNNERNFTISEEEIFEEGGKENGAATFKWEVFFKAYETKKYYYLYINTMQAIILPKREFDKEQNEALRKLISNKLGRKFHKR